jgi:hypothetical protein
MKLRLKVKEIAEAQGYNQSSLARKADIDFKTVKRLFRDPYRTPHHHKHIFPVCSVLQ